ARTRRWAVKKAVCVFLWAFFVLAAPTRAQPPDRLDKIEASLDSLDKKVDSLKSGSWVRDWAPIATTVVGLLGLIASVAIAVVSLNRNAEMNRRTLQQKANEEEAKAIHQKLDEFYGPLSQLRGVSKLLYKIFRSRQPDPENFNTL